MDRDTILNLMFHEIQKAEGIELSKVSKYHISRLCWELEDVRHEVIIGQRDEFIRIAKNRGFIGGVKMNTIEMEGCSGPGRKYTELMVGVWQVLPCSCQGCKVNAEKALAKTQQLLQEVREKRGILGISSHF